MAKLYITEFSNQGMDGNTRITVLPIQPPLAEQTVAIGGTSTQSASLQPGTTMIRLQSDAICSVAIGANPTATTSTARMSAGGTPEYFSVPLNSAFKVAVIANT